MIPLIDADILRYEVGATGQYIDEETGEPVAKDFGGVADNFDQKVKEICAEVWGTEEPILFLSMDARTKRRDAKRIDKKVKRLEKRLEANPLDGMAQKEIVQLEEEKVYKPNFREEVAKKKAYKVGRKASVKPLHYDNLTEYILARYECVMAEGLEADDLLSIHQREAAPLTTIICSRDKDLKMVPGLHFSWACGKQKQFGPECVDEMGRLFPIYRGVTTKGERKLAELKGTGMCFFAAQLLTGDSVDSIPGLPGCGPKKAFEVLSVCDEVDDLFIAVKELYVKKFGDTWDVELLEQGQLLWMVAELDDKGEPVMWQIPEVML